MALTQDLEGSMLAQLTDREREVLRRITLGETNAQIAGALGVTIHAVKFHLGSIFRKLGVGNRTGAAAVYFAEANRARA
jgi:DNA-binding CsgD family transcriptional regulator